MAIRIMRTGFSSFFEKFRRITSGTGYMPEIDGLRFIAISWVVVMMHLTVIININLYQGRMITSSLAWNLVHEGGHGVSFFFMISGFILALPFIRERLYGGQKISLRAYYLRRLTRLEPPYLVALLLTFVLLVFVLKKYSFADLTGNLIASFFYAHNIIFEEHSKVLGVAWSLEVEVVFYLLAPFLCYVFFVHSALLRRGILLTAIILSAWRGYMDLWNPASPFINFAFYFLLGMLLADLYCSKWKITISPVVCQWLGLAVFIGLHLFPSTNHAALYFLKTLLLTVFFYIAITNSWWKKLLSTQWIAIIGGMCYSIYLVHLMIMSGVTKLLVHMPIENKVVGLFVYGIIILAAVLIGSAIFYRFIEQPCMRKGWYKKMFKKRWRE